MRNTTNAREQGITPKQNSGTIFKQLLKYSNNDHIMTTQVSGRKVQRLTLHKL